MASSFDSLLPLLDVRLVSTDGLELLSPVLESPTACYHHAMTTPATSKARLVTIVCGSELEDRLAEGLRKLGFVTGYTTTNAGGRGLHGPRQRGFFDSGNLRVEILVGPEHEGAMMAFLTAEFGDDALTAFAHDVDVLARHHAAP